MRVVVNKEGTFAYTPSGAGAIIKLNASFRGTSSAKGADAPGAAATTPVVKAMGDEIASWGEDNLFPQNVMKDVEKSEVLSDTLTWKAKAWYGSGVVYGYVELDDQGNEKFIRKRMPEVEEFLKRSNINRYALEALTDISFFANAFPEFILSKNRKKIVMLTAQDAVFCRFSKPKTNGVINYCYINANWDNGANITDEYTTRVSVIDPYFDPVESLRARTDDFKYIYPINVPSPGKAEYQLASWNAVRKTGWLDVAKAIPEFKKQLFKNQLSVKYLIEVHYAYWEWKYGDWSAKPVEERQKIIAEELDFFNSVMAGTEGAGKSIIATTVRNPNTGEDIPAFKVTAIDDKIKDGIYIEDSQEAASYIYTAVGVAPTLRGVSPGKGMGAGSGSDARVAFNNFVSTSRFEQDLVLEPLNLIRDYNGWDPELQFRFQNPLIMTLDKGKQVQQETA
ncbi:hypothetical protein [Pontibacter beigongshangensis]|uniref:hypothetical protein n=1 Tax=Pontibacter beigongshangensis TaxID=2574733 RepID=UPI00164F094D|nr:hypothetical protein [Pontibacter beigongshangensis]